MKNSFQLFSIALIASSGVNGALQAEPVRGPAINVFQEPLDFGIGTAAGPIIAGGEDLASPLASAHPIEQDSYKSQYYSHYSLPAGYMTAPGTDAAGNPSGAKKVFLWADGSQGSEPKDRRIASPVDAQGRPLWFDGPAGYVALQNLVAQLYRNGQTADLDHLFEDWNSSKIRMADGRWRLAGC